MEEFQACLKAIRALQTEMNLARQPDSELLNVSEAECRGEANIVELPERAPDAIEEDKLVSRSRRKAQSSSKRKSQTSTSKQKPVVPFRQLRENQPPFVDDLKRLEAQVKRINQILAERSRSQSHQEQPHDELETRSQANPVEQMRSSLDEKRSSKSSKQANLTYDDGEELRMASLDDENSENLKLQAERIHQLLAELEETIQQAGAIAQEPSHQKPQQRATNSFNARREEVNRLGRSQDFRHFPEYIPEYGGFSEPSAQFQSQSQRTPQKNVKRAVQEAAEAAQALRHLTNREGSCIPNGTFNRNTYPEAFSQELPQPCYPTQNSIKRLGLRLRDLFRVPQKPIDKLGDAVLWIVLSAVVRVGSQFLMVIYPAYSPLIIGVMLVPAVLAVYLAVFVPKAGPVSVYRLFLIMLGLLLGGKLF